MTIAELAEVLSEDVIVDVINERTDETIFSGEIEELCRYYFALSEQEISSIISIETTGHQIGCPHILIPIDPDEEIMEEYRDGKDH